MFNPNMEFQESCRISVHEAESRLSRDQLPVRVKDTETLAKRLAPVETTLSWQIDS